MKIDMRFVDAGYEFLILSEYLKLLEANTAEIIEREKHRIMTRIHDEDDEVNRSIAFHLAGRLEDGVITRFLPAGVIVASWAIYESALEEIMEWLRRTKGIAVSLEEAKLRGGVLKRTRKYFSDYLGMELHPRRTDWERLERLSELRNVLAHSNGFLRNVPLGKRDDLRTWVASTSGLLIEDGYIVVSLDFASSSLGFVRELIAELSERVRSAYPLPPREHGP